jgi:hypothetical protein
LPCREPARNLSSLALHTFLMFNVSIPIREYVIGLTRVQIKSLDGEIISLKVKSSDTIYNVKVKIDSVKAKIQDKED